MSQSAMPATKKDMTTCLETFEKERFGSFPHRHGEATGKPKTRDETRWSIKTSISCETSSNFHTLKLQTRRFPTIFLMNLQNRCFVRSVRQFSSPLTKRHACNGICTLSPLDAALTMRFAQNTQHDTSKVLPLPRKMTMEVSKVLHLPRKLELIF